MVGVFSSIDIPCLSMFDLKVLGYLVACCVKPVCC